MRADPLTESGYNHELRSKQMGRTTYPCPGCGQQQTETHENGQEITPKLCPACAEAAQKDQAARAESKGREKAAR
jgi:predicted RNA-binding Zn-ribbon protein involved in translation (DUF1610 family)